MLLVTGLIVIVTLLDFNYSLFDWRSYWNSVDVLRKVCEFHVPPFDHRNQFWQLLVCVLKLSDFLEGDYLNRSLIEKSGVMCMISW